MVVSISATDIRSIANWPLVIGALRYGHHLPKASIGDSLVHARDNTMLVRSAWIDGMASGVKAATVVPHNPDRQPSLPSVHAQIMLFDDETGELSSLVNGTEVTAWKTAGDSALGCDLLANHDCKTFLMIGAGAMAEPLIRAHLSVRPGVEKILLWNRSQTRVENLVANLSDLEQSIEIVADLDSAVPQAQIICCATMSKAPLLKGELVSPGSHVDLVGAYRADMRESNDALHGKGRWFVDSFDTTLDHIGELKIPLEAGLITRDDIKGDLYVLIVGDTGRRSPDEITIFKNGGGAHLDIMVANAFVQAFEKNQ